MKSVIAPALAAIVLAVAGMLATEAGKAETRLTDAHTQLALLQYGAARAQSDAVGESPALARLRGVGHDTATDARELKAAAEYWDGEYALLAPKRDAGGTVTETDPDVLTLAADAAFRTSLPEADKNMALRKLDGVVKNYAEVLRNRPGDADAAYNFEYAVRLRDTVARAKPAAPGAKPANAAARAALDEADLPAGPTVHGRPGGPPPKSEMSQFKIVIPKRGEERKDDPQAGKGGVKVRKG